MTFTRGRDWTAENDVLDDVEGVAEAGRRLARPRPRDDVAASHASKALVGGDAYEAIARASPLHRFAPFEVGMRDGSAIRLSRLRVQSRSWLVEAHQVVMARGALGAREEERSRR